MSGRKIRVSTSIPSLREKIQTNIHNVNDIISWYIKFNLALDESTVSEKTMGVTDIEGYIMRTDISYDPEKNMIVIMPLDSYEQNVFYLLTISKRVKSYSGKKLRSKIHILFKLYEDEISEFKVLKSTVKVPKPTPRPKNYEMQHSKAKIYSFEQNKDIPQDKLPYATMNLNILVAIAGLFLAIVSYFIKNTNLLIISVCLFFIGMGIMIYQISKKTLNSILTYNRGVLQFNSGKYKKAEALFKKSLRIDETNEMAEYAINKVSFYL